MANQVVQSNTGTPTAPTNLEQFFDAEGNPLYVQTEEDLGSETASTAATSVGQQGDTAQ